MNKTIKTFVLGLIVCGLCSCNYGKEDLQITYFKQYNEITDNIDSDNPLRKYNGLIAYDTVRFSDDSYAVHRLQYSPQNSLTEFIDNKGQTITTISRASECYAQTLVYDYDETGKLRHLINFKKEIFDGLEPDTTYLERGINRYLAFRRMIDNLDYEHPDTANYFQTNIEHDKDGNAIKTHIVNSNKSIVAPKGYKLSVSVKPCKSFWESDINGGFYIFHVTMKPKDKHQ